jgi:hypothetical protein
LGGYPVVGRSPFGWLLRIDSRSSELRGPNCFNAESQGFQTVSCFSQGLRVAVGMPVTRHPPHRPVLALLTHTVPTSDAWAPSRSVDQGCSVLPFFAACRTRFNPLGSLPRLDVRHELGSRVLLGQRPSLHNLLRPSPAFVRLLRRYYAAVRLPATVHLGLIAHRLRPAVRVRLPTDGNGVSRFSRVEFLCMHGVSDSAGRGALALSHAVMLSSG